MKIRRRIVGIVAAAVMSVGLMAGPAAAHPALVDVHVGNIQVLNDVNVGLGIAAAANLCGGINVAALVQDLRQTGEATCEADAGTVTVTQQ